MSSHYLNPSASPSEGDNTPPPAPTAGMVMTFGASGFFGYGPVNSPDNADITSLYTTMTKPYAVLRPGTDAVWWSTFQQDELEDSRNWSKDAVRAALIERHKSWKDPVIQKIIRECNCQMFT